MNIGAEEIQALRCGAQGIGAVAVGDEIVYKRSGGVVYLTLDWERDLTKKE